MGLRKLPDGVYVLAEDLHLHRMISELVLGVVRSDKLVLVKTSPGTAAGVAAALDAAGLEEVLGSIAGDDTVLIIAATEEDAVSLVESIDRHRGPSI
jgi:transcriptional regulator of arginine metabolism